MSRTYSGRYKMLLYKTEREEVTKEEVEVEKGEEEQQQSSCG